MLVKPFRCFNALFNRLTIDILARVVNRIALHPKSIKQPDLIFVQLNGMRQRLNQG